MADSPTITAARLALRAAEEEQARALAAATAKSKNKTPSTPPEASPTPASPQADPTTPAPLGVQPGVTIVQDPVTKTNVVEAPDTPPTPETDPQASSAPTTTSGGSETAEQTATDFSLAFGQAKVHVNALFTFLHNTGNAADLDLQGLETHLRALLAPMRTLLSKT